MGRVFPAVRHQRLAGSSGLAPVGRLPAACAFAPAVAGFGVGVGIGTGWCARCRCAAVTCSLNWLPLTSRMRTGAPVAKHVHRSSEPEPPPFYDSEDEEDGADGEDEGGRGGREGRGRRRLCPAMQSKL